MDWQLRRTDTRDSLALSLFDLMESKPIGKVSISAIAERSHCNRATFYRNFDQKEDLVRYRVEMVMDEYLERFRASRDRTQRGYLLRLFETLDDHGRMFELIDRDRLFVCFLEAMERAFARPYEDSGLSVQAEYALAYHVGGIVNHVHLWVKRGRVETPQELADIVLASFPEGFTPVRIRMMAEARLAETAGD